MNRKLFFASLAAMVLSACVVGPPRYGTDVTVAPALPMVVALDSEPYAHPRAYDRFHDDGRWRYSHSRSGFWTALPPSRYPWATRFRGRRDARDRRTPRRPPSARTGTRTQALARQA